MLFRQHILEGIELRLAGDDPRIELRQRLPTREELDALVARLARFDAGTPRSWTTRYLTMIAGQPGIVSHVLARQADADVSATASRRAAVPS